MFRPSAKGAGYAGNHFIEKLSGCALSGRTARIGVLALLAALSLFLSPVQSRGQGTVEAGPPEVPLQEPGSPLPQLESLASWVRGRILANMERVLAHQPGRLSIAVIDTSEGVMYQREAGQKHTLASVGKLYILAAFMDMLQREGRSATPAEQDALQLMISQSNNSAATALWERIGESEGLRKFLIDKGLPVVEPTEEESWGTLQASAGDVGALLLGLYEGHILDAEHTARALSLMASVIDSQSWGIGILRDGEDVVSTYMKNGWYPEEEGWVVNSVGVATSLSESHIYVLLTDSHPTLEEGIEVIEMTVSLIEAGLPD